MVQTLQLSGGTHNVELKGLPAGKYVVQVSQGQSLSQAAITLK